MAVPLWAIALALQGASVGARHLQQKRIENRQEELAAAERIREAGRQQERDAALSGLLANFDANNQRVKIADAQNQREGLARQVQDAGAGKPDDFVADTAAPTEVKSEIASRVADYLRRGREEGVRRARLGGFGDVQFGNQVAIGRTGQQLDMLGDFTRGSQSALGMELEGALNAGRNWGNLADLLGVAGTGLSLYSFTQPATAAATTPATSAPVTKAASPWVTDYEALLRRGAAQPSMQFYK